MGRPRRMTQVLAGRPVLSAGTAPRAAANAASPMAASAFTPARSTSLFLAGRPALAARCLSASSTAYSALGMVKLSRTSLGFFTFSGLAALATGAAGAGALTGAFAAAFTGALAGAFFTVALRTGRAALTAFFTVAMGVLSVKRYIQFIPFAVSVARRTRPPGWRCPG